MNFDENGAQTYMKAGKDDRIVLKMKAPDFYKKAVLGQKVKARGVYVNAQPKLEEVEIVESGPTELVTIDAVKLTAENAKDPEAFVKKYKDKTFLITGELVSSKKNASNAVFAELKGADKARVECMFANLYPDVLDGVAPGSTIQVVGQYAQERVSPDRVLLTSCGVVKK